MTQNPLAGDWSRWRDKVDLDEYETRWQRMAADGQNPHGEVDFVMRYEPASVLDAGCGMGRVAIELARRGVDTVGVDLDVDLLERARQAAPHLAWLHANLAELDINRRFDVVVLAGNIPLFIEATERAAAIANCGRFVAVGGYMISGFQLRTQGPHLADYDQWCALAGLTLTERFATWDGDPYDSGGYAVSVHHRHRVTAD